MTISNIWNFLFSFVTEYQTEKKEGQRPKSPIRNLVIRA